MYNTYLLYQVERQKTAAELRTEDINRGELAKALSRVLHRRGQARPGARDAGVTTIAPVADRPHLSLIRGTGATAAQAAGVPAQRDDRTAC